MGARNSVDFAYKYPFAEEAKNLIKGMKFDKVDGGHLTGGFLRLQSALKEGRLDYRNMDYEKPKIDSIAGYVYCRMLVSATGSRILIKRYAEAEAKRSASALQMDSESNVLDVAKQVGIDANAKEDMFALGFIEFLQYAKQSEENALVNRSISNGMVSMDRHSFLQIVESAIEKAIEKGLPISRNAIPREVSEMARSIKVPVPKGRGGPIGKGGITWIEKLLYTPIPDCRHRTINLILAPYMVNVKNLEVDDAVKQISAYIETCRVVNPNTNITERYIRYQCEWAKKRGMRPLAFARAKNELFSSMDLDLMGDLESEKDEQRKSPV
jgi:hypothetical protein